MIGFLLNKKSDIKDSVDSIKSIIETKINPISSTTSQLYYPVKNRKDKKNLKKEFLKIDESDKQQEDKYSCNINEELNQGETRFIEFFTFINYMHGQYQESIHNEKIQTNLNLEEDVNLNLTKKVKLKTEVKIDIHSFEQNIKFLDIDSAVGFNFIKSKKIDLAFNLGGFYNNSYMPTNQFGFEDLWGLSAGFTLTHYVYDEKSGELSLSLGFPLSTRDRFNLNTSSIVNLVFRYPFSKSTFFKMEYQVDRFFVNEVKVNYNRFWAGLGFSLY